MVDIYNGSTEVKDKQYIYDAFNTFMFSPDRDVFNKLYARAKFYDNIKHLPGDIVECGVFKGTGMMTWLKLMDVDEHHSIRKVIGFDFFDPSFADHLSKEEKEPMKEVLGRVNDKKPDELSAYGVERRILDAGFSPSKFELIQGDVCVTTKDLWRTRPGMRISILYMDLDLGEPTRKVLENLWHYIVPGGIIVFDEYAYHTWTESDGVDEWLESFSDITNSGLVLEMTNIKAPTAYIVKP